MSSLPGAGKTAGIVSPSISLSGKKDFSRGIEYLKHLGFNLVIGQQIENDHFDSEAEIQRAADLMDMFLDPKIDIIFCTSGGAGSQRLLPLLDMNKIKQHPKLLVGHSDNTALQLGLYTCCNNPYISGFSLDYDFRNLPLSSQVQSSFNDILTGKRLNISAGKTLKAGTAEGILIGDCLSMVGDLCGTEYFPDLAGKILILEDECEKPYKIDRLLTSLQQHAQFKKLAGIIFGQFTECDTPKSTYGSVQDILNRFAQKVSFPVLYDFPFGHIKDKYALPLGRRFLLNADAGRLEELSD